MKVTFINIMHQDLDANLDAFGASKLYAIQASLVGWKLNFFALNKLPSSLLDHSSSGGFDAIKDVLRKLQSLKNGSMLTNVSVYQLFSCVEGFMSER